MSLDRTKAALKVYDEGKAAREKSWEEAFEAKDEEAFTRIAARLNAVEKEAEDKVREAFYEDTKDVNSRERAFLVHPDSEWLRRQVAKDGG